MFKPGERYKLICGDCLEFIPDFPDGSIPMVWTDPPYGHGNMQNDLQAARIKARGVGRVSEAEPILNDREEDYRPLIRSFTSVLAPKLDPKCCCCCCCGGGGPRPTFAWLSLHLDKDPYQFFHAIVWDKSKGAPGLGWRYRRNYEMVMMFHLKRGGLRWGGGDALPNVMYDLPVSTRYHPNEKPLGLVQRFIEAHTEPEDIVFDPFMGSGTTGVASIMLGRRFIGIEKDPKYFEIAKRRIESARPGTRHIKRTRAGRSYNKFF